MTQTLCRRAGGARRSLVPTCAVALAGLLASTTGMARTDGAWAGVEATSFIRWAYFPCFSLSCDATFDNPVDVSRGGLGRSLAIAEGFDAQGQARSSADARAIVFRNLALPQLGAKAMALPGMGPHPVPGGSDGAYFYNASATAQAWQYFDYTGDRAQDYTFAYRLTGTLGALLDSPTDDQLRFMTGSGGLSIFDDRGDDLELPRGAVVDIHQQSFDATMSPVSARGEVSIRVLPGESFYLSAFVSAGVGLMGYGYSDFDQTLDVELVAGDPAQLRPFLAPIPEPATAGLLAAGVAALLLARRVGRRPPTPS